jgi:UDP-N-acetylglucosamine 4,6-dehydratase
MHLEGQSILVTGATGSFGQKFVEMTLPLNPERLIVFSRDELKQDEMRHRFGDADPLRYFLGDIRDANRLRRALEGVDIVIHAAALKQVPALEYNPAEAVKTNIIGALNLIDASLDTGVKKVLALSSDKATMPLSLYGATKLVMEKLLIQANSYRGANRETAFSCTRYGNVIGSRGSVVPLFREQAQRGKVTVTRGDMTRFWLTLKQGVNFVLDCVERMHGGEVFVPKIPSMRILDVAHALAPGAVIDEVGIRPGEKLHEAMVAPGEMAVDIGPCYVILPPRIWWQDGQWSEGERMPPMWSYTSDGNDRWLTEEEFLRLADEPREAV